MAQSGHDQGHQGGHLQHGEQVLHKGPLPHAADVHCRQQGDHAAGHQLGRIDLQAQQERGQMGLPGSRAAVRPGG